MSATNRGSERRPNDSYETPEEVTRDFLFNHFQGDYKIILEPCAGSGKMTRVLQEKYPDACISALDIATDENTGINGSGELITGDFLEHTRSRFDDYDLIFTNPPYLLAREVITHAREQWPGATIVMLLRLNFLGSRLRHQWWQSNLPTEVHVLSCRPSFTGKGTDATEYAWFVWRPGVTEQKINVIWGRAD